MPLRRAGLWTDELGGSFRALGVNVARLDDIQVELAHLPLESTQMAAPHRAQADHAEIDPIVRAQHAGIGSRPQGGHAGRGHRSPQEITSRTIRKTGHGAPLSWRSTWRLLGFHEWRPSLAASFFI